MGDESSGEKIVNKLKEIGGHRSTFAWGIRATISRSFGLYLASTFFFGIGVAALTVSLRLYERLSERRTIIENGLLREFEPRRNERYPALNVALLGELSTWNLCQPTGQGASPANQILERADLIAHQFQQYYYNQAQEGASATDHTCNQNRWACESPSELTAPTLQERDTEWTCSFSADHAGGYLHLRSMRRSTSVIVPSFLTASVLAHRGAVAGSNSESQAHYTRDWCHDDHLARATPNERVEWARVAAGVAHWGEIHHAGYPQDGWPIPNSTYFISNTGYITTYPAETSEPPLSYDWLGADYVYRTNRNVFESLHPSDQTEASRRRGAICPPGFSRYGQARHHSLSYLDLFGSGVVVTLCYAIPARYSGAAQGSPALPQPGGVLCFDTRVPRREVLRHFATQDIFNVGIIAGVSDEIARVDIRNGTYRSGRELAQYVRGMWSAEERDEALPDSAIARVSLRAVPRRVAEQILDRYIESQRPSAHSPDPDQIRSVKLDDGTQAIVVRISRESRPGGTRVADWLIAVNPRDERTQLYLAIVFGVLTLGAFMGLQAVRFNLDRRAREWGPMRRLDVGVAIFDGDDQLVSVNDRFEEIVERKLPILGTDPLRYSRLDLARIGSYELWYEFGSGKDRDAYAFVRDCKGSYEPRHVRRFNADRRRYGVREEYFIKIRKTQEWYRVFANFELPFWSRQRPRTFLTLTPVDDEIGEKLDKAAREAFKSAQRKSGQDTLAAPLVTTNEVSQTHTDPSGKATE